MIRRTAVITLTAAVLLLAGCTSFKLYETGDTLALGDALNLTTNHQWSRLDDGDLTLLTVDGPLLDQVRIFRGIADGNAVAGFGSKRGDLPTFKKVMTALEVRDLFAATVQKESSVPIETVGLRPAKLGPNDGFTFDYRLTSNDGVRIRGFVIGAIIKGRLYLIDYRAVELYYYNKYLP